MFNHLAYEMCDVFSLFNTNVVSLIRIIVSCPHKTNRFIRDEKKRLPARWVTGYSTSAGVLLYTVQLRSQDILVQGMGWGGGSPNFVSNRTDLGEQSRKKKNTMLIKFETLSKLDKHIYILHYELYSILFFFFVFIEYVPEKLSGVCVRVTRKSLSRSLICAYVLDFIKVERFVEKR